MVVVECGIYPKRIIALAFVETAKLCPSKLESNCQYHYAIGASCKLELASKVRYVTKREHESSDQFLNLMCRSEINHTITLI